VLGAFVVRAEADLAEPADRQVEEEAQEGGDPED